jgi:uncharacterized protein YoxC
MRDETKLILSQWPVLTRKTNSLVDDVLTADTKDFIMTFDMLVRAQQDLEQIIEQIRPRAVHLHNNKEETEKTLKRAFLKRVK